MTPDVVTATGMDREGVERLLVSIPLPGLVTGELSRIIRANEALVNLLGFPESELAQYTLLDLVDNTQLMDAAKLFTLLESEARVDRELSLRRNRGEPVDLRWIGIVLGDYQLHLFDTNEAGVTIPSRTQVRDLQAESELARTNRMLKDDLKRLREKDHFNTHIQESLRALLMVLDQNNRIITLNTAAEHILGVNLSKVGGTDFFTLDLPVQFDGLADGLRRVRETRETMYVEGLEYLNGEGHLGYLALTYVPLEDDYEKVTGIIALGEDITQRIHLEEQLEAKAAELAHSNKELESFTYVVSHDLKEPLRSISAFSTFLLEDYKEKLDDQGVEYLAILVRSAERMRQLIEDLLELSRIGRVREMASWVDLNSLLPEVAEDLSTAIEERKVHLRIEPELPQVYGEMVRIRQLFANLISNAIKFNSNPQPEVEVGFRPGTRTNTFYVKDNGPGIDPRYHEKIFQIFQRLGLRDEVEGTGAGLTICRKIVEDLGGQLWVESREGQGANFLFTMPRGGSTETEEK